MTRPAPIYPPALKQGDKVGIIAPSSTIEVGKLKDTIEFLRKQGFIVEPHLQINKKHGQFAGTVDDKVLALHDYFRDPSIKAIFCTTGGNGAIHLLDQIDYDLIKTNPKIIMGYSDITILLNTISAKTGLVTFHGPTLSRFDKIEIKWQQQMQAVLMGQTNELEFKHDLSTEGILYGGNLSVLQALIGTNYAPDMNGAVLMIEDIADHFSRYDRMLGHMKQAGWLDNLSAVLVGGFLENRDNPDRPFGFTMEEIIENNCSNTPILYDFPIGHGEQLCTLPIGANVVLKNNTVSFKALS